MAINLQKGKKIELRKSASRGLGEILVNLNWNSKPANQGFWSSIFGSNEGIDLDLCCLYELKDGSMGAVQALGKNFGSLVYPPYISLDGDDRTGESEDGENIRINGNMLKEFKRILVYTYIYEGIANWKQADALVTIKYPGAEDIYVKMDEFDTDKGTCALVLLENVNDVTFRVEKIIKFYNGAREMDKDFHWGLRWTTGRKD